MQNILDLASNMHWPFAMVCIAVCALFGVVYITRRTLDATETAAENRRLESENYRLTHVRSEE